MNVKEPRLDRLRRERYAKVLHAAKPDEQGFVTADIEFQTLESACEIVLACGPEARVLEPPELRERVRREAESISQLYSGSGE